MEARGWRGILPCERAAGPTTAAATAGGPTPAAVTATHTPTDWAASHAASPSATVLPTTGGIPNSSHSTLLRPYLVVSTASRRSATAAILRRAKQRARHRAAAGGPAGAAIAAVEGGVPGQPDRIMVQGATGPAMQRNAPLPPAVPPAGAGGAASAPLAAGAAPPGPPQQLHGVGDLGGGQAAVGMDLDLDLDLDLQAPLPRRQARALLPAAAQPTDLAGGGVPAGLMLVGPPLHPQAHAAVLCVGGGGAAAASAAGVQATAEGLGGSAALPQLGEVVSWRICINGWDLRQGYLGVPKRVATSGAFGTAWQQDLQRLLSPAVPMSEGTPPQRSITHPLDVVDEGTGATHRAELRVNVVRRQDGRVRRWGTHVAKLMRKLRGKVAEGDTLVFRSAGPYGSGGSGTVPAPPPASAAGQEPGGGAPATGSADVGAPAAAGASCSGAGLPQPAATARVWMWHVPRQQPQQGGGGAAASAAGEAAAGGGRKGCCSSSSSDGDGDSEDYDDDEEEEYRPRRRPPGRALGRQPPAGTIRMPAAGPGRGGQRSGRTAGTGAEGRGPRHGPRCAATAQPAPGLPTAASPAHCVEWSCTLTGPLSQGVGSFHLPVTNNRDCGATFQPYVDALRHGSRDGDRRGVADGGGRMAAAAGQQQVGTVYALAKGALAVSVAVDNRLRPQLGPLPAELRITMYSGRGKRADAEEFYLRQIFELLREAGLREGDTITFSRHSVPQGTAGLQRAGGGVGAGAAATSRLPALMLSWGGTQAGGLTRPELPGRPAGAAGAAAVEHSSAAGTTGNDAPPPAALVAQWSHVLKASHVRLGARATFGLPVQLKQNCRATFQPFVDALLGSCASEGGGPACSASAGPAACCRQPVAYLSGKGIPTVSVAVDNRLGPPQLGPQPAAELRIAIMYRSRRDAYELHLHGILKLLREAGLREGDTITFSRHSVPQGTAGQRGSGVGTGAAASMPPLITLTCSRRNRGNEQNAVRLQDSKENEEEGEAEQEEEEEGDNEEHAGTQRCKAPALTGNEGYGGQLAAGQLTGTAALDGLIAGPERSAGPPAATLPPSLASPAGGPMATAGPGPTILPRAPVPHGAGQGRAPATSGRLESNRRLPPRSALPAAVPPTLRRPAAVAAAGLAGAAVAAAAPAARSRPTAGTNAVVATSPLAAAIAAQDRGPPSTPPAQLTAPAARGQQGRCSQSPPRKRAKHSGSGAAPPQNQADRGGLGASSAAGASARENYPWPDGGASTSAPLAPLAPQALPSEAVPPTVLIDACDEVLAAVEALFPRPSMAALGALADALNTAPTHWPPVRQVQLVRQLLPRLRGAVREGGEAGAQRAAVYVKSFLAVDMMMG